MSSSVIGELHFRQAGRPLTAQLDDRLHWSCEDDAVEQLLNDTLERDDLAFRGEIHQPLVHKLYQIAERLGAEVHVPREPAGA